MRKSHEIRAELNAKIAELEKAEGEARAALVKEVEALTIEFNEASVAEHARMALANGRAISPEASEMQRFSISKFLRELRDGGVLTGIEKEMAEEGAKDFVRAMGKTGEGFCLPVALLRDLTYTNATEDDYGKALVTEGVATYIEALRRDMVSTRLGVRFMNGLVGNIPMIKGGGAQAAWLTEEGTTSVSKPQYSKALMKPHRLQIIQGVTYDLIHQSSLAVDSLIMSDLRKAHAEALDAAIFAGSGTSGQPTGIINATGVNTVAMGATGGALTYEKLVEFETAVGEDNGLYGKLAYVVNAKTNGKAKTTPQVAGYPLYLFIGGEANGYPVVISNALPSNLTKSTGSGLSAMIFGNFNEVVVGGWGGLQFIIDPYSEKEKGVIEISAHAYHDVFVRRPECFAVANDVATA